VSEAPEETIEDGGDGLEPLLEFIRENRGFDFTGYKRPTLRRRIAKRMEAVDLETFSDYQAYLEANGDEFAHLFDTILINVTGFFRDAPTWEYLAQEVVPQLASADTDGAIRIWSTGCASGEEAYSIAILLAEALGDDAFRHRVKVYATDVDEEALTYARHAAYSSRQLEGLPEELRERYFEPADGHHVFRSDLRRSVIFGRHDLVRDPPISRVDLLLARNTLMYFNPQLQAKILGDFHFALDGDGYLVLGKSEMLLTRTRLFQPVDLKRRVFVKASPGPRSPRPFAVDHERERPPVVDETS
jgi:two-component system, chemotaxis family, CheB/CheR fusion protein